MTSANILVEASRGDYIENRYSAWIVATDASGCLLYSTPGALEVSTFFRSSAKPFQSLPLVLSGMASDLSLAELAIACASHEGAKEHLEVVEGLLQKANITPNAFRCGPHMPANLQTQEHLRNNQQAPQAIHNNCSGKHAGMLYYCAQLGLDLESYLDIRHPLQQEIVRILKDWTGLPEIPWAIDGCGAPTFYLPLSTMAHLFARLGVDPIAAPLVNAMTQYPILIGGAGRLDTVLMQITQGRLLAKVGADGVVAVSRVGSGEGLFLKLEDGNNDIRNKLLPAVLLKLGWLTPEEFQHPDLAPYRSLDRLNTQGKTVGKVIFHLNAG